MLFQRDDSVLDIAKKLSTEFEHVTNIGEIDLTEDDFRVLRTSVHDTWDKYTLAPEVVAAVLVFCARYVEYGEDERIGFWEKFSQTVLKRDLNQQIGNAWRDKFKAARDKLRERYGFVFPTQKTLTQHVIGGIYTHAILPAYLADEFIEWFLKEYPTVEAWTRLKEHYPDEIAEHHLKRIEVKQPHIRLKRFLSEEETRLTACKLVRNLATAAWWYVQRKFEGDDIASLLSPIERSLWGRLSLRLDALHLTPKAISRESRIRQRWAWFVKQNTILELHVKDLQIHGHTEPRRLVWFPLTEDIREGETVPRYGANFCEVNAWDVGKGYVIDNATLIDIREEGWLVPVDTGDRALCPPIKTITLPQEKNVALFRVQPETSFAILSDWDRLTSGDYAISHTSNFSIKALEGGEVIRNYKLQVPDALGQQGHIEAAHYTLRLPVEINGERINPQRNRISPTLHGQNPIAGLLANALPIYGYGDVWLSFTTPKGVPLNKLSLELVVNDTVSIHRLTDLDAVGHIEREEEDGQTLLKLRLTSYLVFPALIQATVYNGLNPMHGEPRVAGVLPDGISVEPDATDEYYSLSKRPDVCLSGVTLDQIEPASDVIRSPIDEQNIIITWEDPRQDAALRLVFGAVKLPLTFDVKWSYGWIEPLKEGYWLDENRLDEAQLHVRGKPKSPFYIEVNEVGRSSAYILNSLGVMDVEIKNDRLKDLLLGYEDAETPVSLIFADQPNDKTELCGFVRPDYQPVAQTGPITNVSEAPVSPSTPVAPEGIPRTFIAQPSFTIPKQQIDWSQRALNALKHYPTYRHRTEHYTDSHLLALVKRETLRGFSPNAIPSILSPIVNIPSTISTYQRRLFPPKAEWLWVGDDRYEILTDTDGKHIFLPRPTTQGEKEVRIGIEERDREVNLRPYNNLLRQCHVCEKLYWQDDRSAKTKHAHDRLLPRGIDLSKESLLGEIHPFGKSLMKARDYVFNFSPFVNHNTLLLVRNVTDPTASRRALDMSSGNDTHWFSIKRYDDAVAEWFLMTTTATKTNMDDLCAKEASLQQVWKRWTQSTNPGLVWGYYWITHEMRTRQRKGGDYPALIPILMALAIVARGHAHGYQESLHGEHEQYPIEEALRLAYGHFKPLMTWALAWAEFNFVYWKDGLG